MEFLGNDLIRFYTMGQTMGIIKRITDITETVIMPDGTAMRVVPSLSPECEPLQRAGIILLGINDAAEGYFVERNAHPVHEVLLCLSGKGRVWSDTESRELVAGELLIAPGGTRYGYTSEKPPWRFLWCQLHDQGVWRGLRSLDVHVRKAHYGKEIESTVTRLLADSVGQELHWARVTTLLSELVVLYLERELAVEDSLYDRTTRQQLEELWSIVSARLDKQWSVQELAQRVNMSCSSFYRACRRSTGDSPKQMLIKLRMQRAEELLRNYDYPLKIVADMLGYQSPFAFSNSFKRHKGMSPRDYRALAEHSPRK